jgi:hypothetical protein
VVAYFKRLPDEELSSADIAIKWHADQKNVSAQLAKAVEADLLCKNGTVYYAGPNIGQIDLSPSAIAAGSTPMVSKRHVRTIIDIESIELEDAPAGLAAPMKAHDRWVAKLKTMPAGKSFVVPHEYRHAVRTAASAVRKEGWRISVLAERENQVRVVCLVARGVQS